MKLAREFFDFAPCCTGTISAELAYLTFANETDLKQFIEHADGHVLQTGDKLSARQLKPTDSGDSEEASLRRKKQELRAQKKMERSLQKEQGDLGDVFSDW
jgi:hypothetical protein